MLNDADCGFCMRTGRLVPRLGVDVQLTVQAADLEAPGRRPGARGRRDALRPPRRSGGLRPPGSPILRTAGWRVIDQSRRSTRSPGEYAWVAATGTACPAGRPPGNYSSDVLTDPRRWLVGPLTVPVQHVISGEGGRLDASASLRSAPPVAGDLHPALALLARHRRPGPQPGDRPAPFLMPMEPYAGYQPQTSCRRTPKPGVLMLADWLVARGGDTARSAGRARVRAAASTRSRGPSTGSSTRPIPPTPRSPPPCSTRSSPPTTSASRTRSRAGWGSCTSSGTTGCGRPTTGSSRSLLSSGCRNRRTCSPTLRHRDHLHVSLTRQGAKGITSWYYAQEPPV